MLEQEYIILALEAAKTGDWSKADAWMEERFPGWTRIAAFDRAFREWAKMQAKLGRKIVDILLEEGLIAPIGEDDART